MQNSYGKCEVEIASSLTPDCVVGIALLLARTSASELFIYISHAHLHRLTELPVVLLIYIVPFMHIIQHWTIDVVLRGCDDDDDVGHRHRVDSDLDLVSLPTVRLVREEDWQKTQYTSRLFIEENYSHSPYMRADMRQGIKTTEMWLVAWIQCMHNYANWLPINIRVLFAFIYPEPGWFILCWSCRCIRVQTTSVCG